VITGTSSGIGLLAAVDMAKAGFRVVATMRNLERRTRLDQAAAVAAVSDRIEVRRLDVCETESFPSVVTDIVRAHGRIDVLVNNAGFPMAGFAEDVLLPELRAQFETNFFGTVALTRAVLPIMRQQRSGHIIMVSSISGRVGQVGVSSYSASKFALEGWAEVLRIETHSLGIRVVLIEPGGFKTDIWDKGVQIGKVAMSPESPNKERTRRYAEFVKSHTPKNEALPVAQLITRVAHDPNPRLRYIIGTDAKVQRWLRALMPWKRYEKMMARVTRID
jgi:NAD(P)-dependent dehydrogenase (short-subunit alcohol dehydrogenase family)